MALFYSVHVKQVFYFEGLRDLHFKPLPTHERHDANAIVVVYLDEQVQLTCWFFASVSQWLMITHNQRAC